MVVVVLVVVSWEVVDVSQLLLSHTPMRVRWWWSSVSHLKLSI